jgi:hypothetical protein
MSEMRGPMSGAGGSARAVLTESMASGADFSECRIYRYRLWRAWDNSLPTLNVVGLNPSTADETVDDPTIRRCIGFARDWGYGGLVMTNLFAYRSTDPKALLTADDPIGPCNKDWLTQTALLSEMVLAAWGAHVMAFVQEGVVRRAARGRLYCLGLTKSGAPRHPLYMPKSCRPTPYPAQESAV